MTPLRFPCSVCAAPVMSAVRAGNSQSICLDQEPDKSGVWMFLTLGEDSGRVVLVGGPLLARARAEVGVKLYTQHHCSAPVAA